MSWTRTISVLSLAGASLAAAAPAFADPPSWAPAHGYRARHFAPRTVVVHPRSYFVAAPRPVYAYPAPAYYAPPPRPAYRVYPGNAAGGAVIGAVAGALIGGSVAHGDEQVAGIAIGSVLGAVIGHELAGGY